jgi:glucose/arabinose dehydrogenase
MPRSTIRLTSILHRSLRAAVAATLGLLVLAACGGSAPPVTLLVGNTRGNNVVSLNSATGAYLGDFIAAGSGGLTDPDDLTLGPDGNLYVSSGTPTTGQILRYHGQTGAFIDVFAQGHGMKRPYGNAFGPDGHLYVASFRSDQILKFDGTTGAFLAVFASGNGTQVGLLNGPNDLSFGSDGHLYVTTQGSVADGNGGIRYLYESQILRYNLQTGLGTVFAPAPSPTPGGNGYVSFLGLAWGPDGLLYATDYAGGIRSYDPRTGVLQQTIDTGALFGGSIATTLGNLSIVGETLHVPIFNEDSTGGIIANGVANCDITTATCRLLRSDSTHLFRPIGIVIAP